MVLKVILEERFTESEIANFVEWTFSPRRRQKLFAITFNLNIKKSATCSERSEPFFYQGLGIRDWVLLGNCCE